MRRKTDRYELRTMYELLYNFSVSINKSIFLGGHGDQLSDNLNRMTGFV